MKLERKSNSKHEVALSIYIASEWINQGLETQTCPPSKEWIPSP